MKRLKAPKQACMLAHVCIDSEFKTILLRGDSIHAFLATSGNKKILQLTEVEGEPNYPN